MIKELTNIEKLAYKLYVKSFNNGNRNFPYLSDSVTKIDTPVHQLYFIGNGSRDSFKKFYKQAEQQIRLNKINKLLKC